jgi:hypothetical protein
VRLTNHASERVPVASDAERTRSGAPGRFGSGIPGRFAPRTNLLRRLSVDYVVKSLRLGVVGLVAVVLASACSSSAVSPYVVTVAKPQVAKSANDSREPVRVQVPRRLCEQRWLAASFRYEDAGGQQSYGAISIRNTSAIPCAISRHLTVSETGPTQSHAQVRTITEVLSGRRIGMEGHSTVWAPTDTVLDLPLTWARHCPAARTVSIQVGHSAQRLPIQTTSLKGKNRIILRLCHLVMTIDPVQHQEP